MRARRRYRNCLGGRNGKEPVAAGRNPPIARGMASSATLRGELCAVVHLLYVTQPRTGDEIGQLRLYACVAAASIHPHGLTRSNRSSPFPDLLVRNQGPRARRGRRRPRPFVRREPFRRVDQGIDASCSLPRLRPALPGQGPAKAARDRFCRGAPAWSRPRSRKPTAHARSDPGARGLRPDHSLLELALLLAGELRSGPGPRRRPAPRRLGFTKRHPGDSGRQPDSSVGIGLTTSTISSCANASICAAGVSPHGLLDGIHASAGAPAATLRRAPAFLGKGRSCPATGSSPASPRLRWRNASLRRRRRRTLLRSRPLRPPRSSAQVLG